VRLLCLVCAMLILPCSLACAAEDTRLSVPVHLSNVHPRSSAHRGGTQREMRALIEHDKNAQQTVERARAELAPYLEHVRQDPMWVASRLQMYWKSHATEIYNRGDVFDHAEGHAPVPTVRFPGSRNPSSIYRAPRLEDIPPYEDDTRGVWLVNAAAPGQPLEWASPSKTGRVIDGMNASIMRMAQNAAQLAWLTGDEEYARFAFTIFDTYMRGMKDRSEPIDLNHGHSQTIYGLSTFEVIQESNILPPLATIYDYLFDYLKSHHANALPLYADIFRKWIDVTLSHGVPFNNWNLFEDNIAVSVAVVLEDDEAYADGHGAQYYLERILNEDTIRHWSLSKMAARGFDRETGIWFESPGYSMTVVADFLRLINRIDRETGSDLLSQLPVVRKGTIAMAQYAFPNGITVSWGDSHYGPISSEPARLMVANARMHHHRDDEIYFTGLARLFDDLNRNRTGGSKSSEESHSIGTGLNALFTEDQTVLDASIPALKPGEVFPAMFSAPSASYLVQRNGLDPATGLMIAEAGSLGNHQHANGITMELYGEGLPLAPDSGIGTNYFEADHNEYYAQFPAHNTVAVDGVSAYPTMLSHHGFTVNASYPFAQKLTADTIPMTYTDVSFVEPETESDQRRVMGTVRLSKEDGYYIDIFRSHRRDGQDRTQDYFFHGLGQKLEIAGEDGRKLASIPTDKLTFAEESLGAYDYFWDKRAVVSSPIYHARYDLELPGRSTLQLHAWMMGGAGRSLYEVMAPAARSLRDTVPTTVSALPLHTLILRQSGEAWTHPFVAVFEPARADKSAKIRNVALLQLSNAPSSAVALQVEQNGGRRQTILSGVSAEDVLDAGDFACKGSYGFEDVQPGSESFLLDNGTWIKGKSLRVTLREGAGSAYVRQSGTDLWMEFSKAATLEILATEGVSQLQIDGKKLIGERVREGSQEWIRFVLPATVLREVKLLR